MNYAWPTARIAVIGAEGAAQLLVKRFPDPIQPHETRLRLLRKSMKLLRDKQKWDRVLRKHGRLPI